MSRPGSVRTASCWWPATSCAGGGGNLLRVWHLGRRELLASLRTGETAGSRWGVLPRQPSLSILSARRGASTSGTGPSAGWSGGCRWTSRRTIWRSIRKGGGSRSTTPMGRAAGRDPRARIRPRAGGLEITGRQYRIWHGVPTGNSWPSAATPTTPASTSGTSAAKELASVLAGTYFLYHQRPVRAHGLPAGATSWRRRHDPALGCRLRRATGDRAGNCIWVLRRMTAGWPTRRGTRSASGTLPRATNAERSTRPCSATAASGETPQRVSGAFSPDGRLLATGDARRRPALGGRHGSGGRPPQGSAL